MFALRRLGCRKRFLKNTFLESFQCLVDLDGPMFRFLLRLLTNWKVLVVKLQHLSTTFPKNGKPITKVANLSLISIGKPDPKATYEHHSTFLLQLPVSEKASIREKLKEILATTPPIEVSFGEVLFSQVDRIKDRETYCYNVQLVSPVRFWF